MPYTQIDKSTDYFNTKLYTGNETTGHSITGVGHQPDLVWIKNRTNSKEHHLFDAVRGATKFIETSTSDAEETATDTLSSFDADGFTLGNSAKVNANTMTTVSWNWKAGTSFNNSAGSNGADIASSGSVNTAAGFSIIKATSDSAADKNIAHGLGVVPDAIFSKNLDSGYNWDVYFKSLGYNSALRFNTNNQGNLTGKWGSSAFTANTFHTKNDYSSTNGEEYIYYCFASKTGFSKIGSYIGSNAQSHIYTGFKPKWVMIKRTDSADNWKILDSERSTFNIMNETLSADNSGAEATETDVYVDFLSNGIRLDGSNGAIHANQGSYVYMAFADAPLVGSNNIPCTAR